MELKGRIISKGVAEGEALTTTMPISFYGGVDPETSEILEKGKILVFPNGKGSTVGSYTLYRLKKGGVAPAGIINRDCETVVAVGAIISEIPCVDEIDISKIETGDTVRIENGVVKIEK
jgi:predicted aconitase with swiveling domain